jgi:hypothetical protein
MCYTYLPVDLCDISPCPLERGIGPSEGRVSSLYMPNLNKCGLGLSLALDSTVVTHRITPMQFWLSEQISYLFVIIPSRFFDRSRRELDLRRDSVSFGYYCGLIQVVEFSNKFISLLFTRRFVKRSCPFFIYLAGVDGSKSQRSEPQSRFSTGTLSRHT